MSLALTKFDMIVVEEELPRFRRHPVLLNLDQCHRRVVMELVEKGRGVKEIEQINQLIVRQNTPLEQLLLINQRNSLQGLSLVYDHQHEYQN